MATEPATDTALAGLTRFFVVPHTHWDREWYAPFEEFQLRLGAVVDEVIDVLESDPSFTCFTLDGQAIVIEDYVEARPENEGRLRALIEAGRLEIGPSYILPDELLVGAEALVRNLLIGRAVCRRYGAEPSAVGYMPDSFGHPLQLPQILNGFGIETFVFSRGMGDELDDVGVVFRWRSPDGSEVRAFQQLPWYGNFSDVRDGDSARARIEQIADRFGNALERARVDALLLCDGEDHRRIRRDLPALCSELERRLPGTTFRIARFADYVGEVDPGGLPAHTGELLGSRLQNVLRGVNSARLYLKRANDRAERRLLEVETLGALRTLHTGQPFPVADFRLAWRQLLKCHPHDSICGCSCDEVHRDMLVRYEQLERTVAQLERRAVEAFAVDTQDAVGAANLLPYPRRGLVEVPGREPAVVELDGFTARPVELAPAGGVHQRDGVDQDGGAAIESDLIRVEAAPDGTLSVFDKPTGARFEHLHRLEDEPDIGDLYNFCPAEGAVPGFVESAWVRVRRDGPVVWELEIGMLTVRTTVRLVAGIRRVEFRTTIDNQCKDHRLRAVFPTSPAPGPLDSVRAEGQFAVVHRPLSPPPPRTDWVEPPDPTQHTLGVVALGRLALVTKGLPEYEARGDELCLTLLRCVGVISRPTGALTTRPLGAGPGTQTPDGQCLGAHEFEYALLPGADELDDAELARASQDYRYGFLVTPRPLSIDPPINIEGDVVFSCLKGAEDGDGLILRCFNPKATPARIGLAGAFTHSRVRLDETATAHETAEGQAADLLPGEIGTFRLRPRT